MHQTQIRQIHETLAIVREWRDLRDSLLAKNELKGGVQNRNAYVALLARDNALAGLSISTLPETAKPTVIKHSSSHCIYKLGAETCFAQQPRAHGPRLHGSTSICGTFSNVLRTWLQM